jgi:hypothetical protein
MNTTDLVTYLLVHGIGNEARSALPGAPVISERAVRGPRKSRIMSVRARLANVLHQLGWWLEPPSSVHDWPMTRSRSQ